MAENINNVVESVDPKSKWAAIVESESKDTMLDSELNSKKPKVEPLKTSKPKDASEPKSKWSVIVDNDEDSFKASDIVSEKVLNIDLEDYTGYLGSDIYESPEGIEGLNRARANNQSWYGQAANMVGQAVVGEIIGGTIEAAGYLLDVGTMADIIQGKETEWTNSLSDIGKSVREASQEAMPIYETNPGELNMADTGWWFSNGVSVASSLSMMLPSMAATRALSFLGKGLSRSAGAINKSLDLAANMGKKASWMTQGVTQAIVSRHIENSMEASGTFESAKADYLTQIDPNTGEVFTEEKAKSLASDAAASNYQAGWAMLLQDIPQYLALGRVFNPNSLKMESALSKASKAGKNIKMKPWQQKLKAGAITFGSEGFEESYQYYVAERGKALSDLKAGLITEKEYEEEMSSKIGDDEMKTSAFWGGLGGNLFQAAGKGVDKVFKGKTGRAREEAYAADQVKYIEHRGRQFAGLQKELAAADQANDPARRTIALNEMMMAMALDAVAMGKFDEHIESLQNMTELTPEEAAKYKDEHGVELNVDLFKQSVPEMIKLSEKVREKQLKYQDKYDSDISASLTRNDMNTEMFQNRIDELSKNESTLMQKTPGANLIGEKSKAIAHYQRTMLVHKELVKSLNKKLTESKSDLRSKELKKAIAREESNVVEAEKNIKKSKEIKETLTTEEKANNDKGVKANKAISEELAQSMFERVSLEDAILRGYNENEFLKSKAYGSRKKKEDIRRAVEGIINDKQASDAKKVIEENPDFTRAEKDVLIEKIDNKLIEIEKFKSDELEKAKKANEEDEIIKEKQEEAKNNPEKIPNNNIAPVLDNYEDPHADEETPLDQLLEEDDNTEELKADEAKTMKLLDQVEGTERFQAWSANGLNKEGVEVEFVVGEGMSENNKKAIADFNAGNITQHTYDYYPIKVLVNAGVEGVYSFLPTRTEKNTNFDTNELPQRKIIVDQLSSGKKVTSVVSRTTGGGLLTEEGDPSSPAPPANNILELSEYLNMDASDVQVLLTNEDGQFFDVNKDLYMPLAGRQLLVSGVEDPVAYKGGVFVMITKANGDKFPLRVNLSKHSSIEADTIADLLIEMAVKKSIKGGTRLSQLSEELQALVKSNDPKALEALGKEPSVSEIINLLTYVTKATAGLESELYMKGNTIRFANGRVLSAENIEEGREDLVDFLLNKKRKQFNLNLWNKSDAYKQYIIETKTISTNAKTGSIPFGNDNNGRKVGVYIERVKGDPAEVNPISSEGVNTNNPDLSNTGSKELDDRIALSTSSVKESSGEQKRDGKFVGSYYYPKGSAMYAAGARDLVIGRDTAEEVQKALNEKYYAEARKVKAKPAPKKKKDIKNPKTVAQLKDEAKSKGIRGYSKMNKAQLKEALYELKNTEPQTGGAEFNPKEFGMIGPGNTNGTSFPGFRLYQGKGKDNRNPTDEEINTLDKLVNLYIEQVAKGNMTIPDVVEALTRKGYSLELPQWQQLRDYITSVTNPNVPKIGNNKDSFTDWRQKKVNTKPTQANDVEAKKAAIAKLEAEITEKTKARKGNTISIYEISKRQNDAFFSDKEWQELNAYITKLPKGVVMEGTPMYDELVALGVKPSSNGINASDVDKKLDEIANKVKAAEKVKIKKEGLKVITNDARKAADKEFFDKINAEYNAKIAALESPQTSSVEELRKQEQLELIKSIPNADKYLTDGKVDKEKITNPEDVAKFEKIYDKYDKLISPLMGEKTTPTTPQTSEVAYTFNTEQEAADFVEANNVVSGTIIYIKEEDYDGKFRVRNEEEIEFIPIQETSGVESKRQFQNKVYIKAYDNLRNKPESELKSIVEAGKKSARSGGQSSPISVAESFIARKILDGKTKELDVQFAKPAPQTSEVKLTSEDKIVWGHPGLGKTTFKQANPNNVLDFDTDFKPEVAKALGLPKNKQNSKGLNEWRKNNSEEAFKSEMRKAWKKAVAESKKTGKILVVSDMMFLEENEADFDKVVTTSKEAFKERATKRGDNTKGLDSWKSNIDKTISSVDSSKVINTDKYFSEIQPTKQASEVDFNDIKNWKENNDGTFNVGPYKFAPNDLTKAPKDSIYVDSMDTSEFKWQLTNSELTEGELSYTAELLYALESQPTPQASDNERSAGVKELISVYTGGGLFFNTDASGFEVSESLKANGVSLEQAKAAIPGLGGKLQAWFQRGVDYLEPTQQTSSEVDLGTETAPKGGKVEIEKVKGKTPQPGAVVAFRTKGKTEQNMIDALKDNAVGNPFGPYGAIKEETVVSVTRFLNWLEGKGDTNVMQNYRKAILNKASELKGKTIFYYTDLGRPSHATALDYFLNKPTQTSGGKVVNEVADGVKIIDNALTSSEEAEIFQMIKPFLESQGSRSNKGNAAPIMIGMGLRWDYKSNNPGKSPVEIKETIVNSQGQRNKYAYYDVSIDGEALGAIPTRLKELMTKATGVDASNYDGAIINIYPKNGFISAHNDVDESVTAINYPVIVANIGGTGSLSIEGAESQKARKGYSSKEYVNEPLSSGSAYIFGEDGKNRNVFHRTLPSSGKGNLPQLNVKGQIIPANSYRISVTLRRVKDLEPGMPTTPNKISPAQQTNYQTSLNFDENSLNLKSSIETDLSNDLEAANMIRKEPVKKAEEKTNSQSLGSKEAFVAEVFGEKTKRRTRKEIEAEKKAKNKTPETGCK